MFNFSLKMPGGYRVKVAVVGDSNVGKTVLVKSMIHGPRPGAISAATIGVDFERYTRKGVIDPTTCRAPVEPPQNAPTSDTRKGKKKEVEPSTLTYQLYDTAGQDRFASIVVSYWKNSHTILLCASVERIDSLLNLARKYRDVHDRGNENSLFILCITKNDLRDDVCKTFYEHPLLASQPHAWVWGTSWSSEVMVVRRAPGVKDDGGSDITEGDVKVSVNAENFGKCIDILRNMHSHENRSNNWIPVPYMFSPYVNHVYDHVPVLQPKIEEGRREYMRALYAMSTSMKGDAADLRKALPVLPGMENTFVSVMRGSGSGNDVQTMNISTCLATSWQVTNNNIDNLIEYIYRHSLFEPNGDQVRSGVIMDGRQGGVSNAYAKQNGLGGGRKRRFCVIL